MVVVCHGVNNLGHVCKRVPEFCSLCECFLSQTEEVVVCLFPKFENILGRILAESHCGEYAPLELIKTSIHANELCLVKSGVSVLLSNSSFEVVELLLGCKRLGHKGAGCIRVCQRLLSIIEPLRRGCFVLEPG